MTLSSFLYTHAGGRSYNEDAVGAWELPGSGLYVVADGLGGQLHSEQASAAVIQLLTEGEKPQEDADGAEWLRDRLREANDKVLSLQEETHSNMKSTAVALLVRGDRASWAHVGDSRLYYIHDREIAAITEDHSVAFKKYKAGEISREEIGADEDQSALLRALGNAERYEPDLGGASGPLTAGDGFLLCSDGLWEFIRDGEILIDFLKTDTPEKWAERLMLRAMDRFVPEHDNLSLITVMVR